MPDLRLLTSDLSFSMAQIKEVYEWVPGGGARPGCVRGRAEERDEGGDREKGLRAETGDLRRLETGDRRPEDS